MTSTHSLLNIGIRFSSGEVRRGGEWGRVGENLAAVDEVVGVVAELAHGTEDELEAVLELSLVSCEKISSRPAHSCILWTYCRRTATRKQCESRGQAVWE